MFLLSDANVVKFHPSIHTSISLSLSGGPSWRLSSGCWSSYMTVRSWRRGFTSAGCVCTRSDWDGTSTTSGCLCTSTRSVTVTGDTLALLPYKARASIVQVLFTYFCLGKYLNKAGKHLPASGSGGGATGPGVFIPNGPQARPNSAVQTESRQPSSRPEVDPYPEEAVESADGWSNGVAPQTAGHSHHQTGTDWIIAMIVIPFCIKHLLSLLSTLQMLQRPTPGWVTGNHC